MGTKRKGIIVNNHIHGSNSGLCVLGDVDHPENDHPRGVVHPHGLIIQTLFSDHHTSRSTHSLLPRICMHNLENNNDKEYHTIVKEKPTATQEYSRHRNRKLGSKTNSDIIFERDMWCTVLGA